MAVTTAATTTPSGAKPVSAWLFVVAALIAVMVIVGGATRLTDSGLAIVEWRPVTGAIPPLTEADWRAEFEKYKAIPEYQLVNRGMSLAAFKQIYWWEWGHRFLGRFVGAAFLLPFLYFLLRRMIKRRLAWKLAGLFVLGGLQGALGWWMVASGLSERIDVSQYRLAAHLALAVLLFAATLWIALDLRFPSPACGRGDRGEGATTKSASVDTPSPPVPLPQAGEGRGALRVTAIALVFAVYLQMILGAFVAGLRAGRLYNTWPLMDGRFFPEGYFSGPPGFNDLFETAAAAQFNHRIGAYLVAAAAVAFFFAARKTAAAGNARILLLAVFAQIALGIWTVITATPLPLGLLHQAGALAVLAAAVVAAHRIRYYNTTSISP